MLGGGGEEEESRGLLHGGWLEGLCASERVGRMYVSAYMHHQSPPTHKKSLMRIAHSFDARTDQGREDGCDGGGYDQLRGELVGVGVQGEAGGGPREEEEGAPEGPASVCL